MSRSILALAACEGLTDQELAKRGAGAFAKMINRKRAYAHAARTLKVTAGVMGAELLLARQQLEKAQQDLAQAQATIAMLDAMDAPVTDTSAASELLAGIMNSQD